MTTKEIARAVGKDVSTVARWIEKLLVQNADVDVQNADVKSIRLKAGSKDPHRPADYTLEETIAVIEAGMGPDAAGVFRANAFSPRREAKPVTASLIRECRMGYRDGVLSRRAVYRLLDLESLSETDRLDPLPDPAREQLALPLNEELREGLRFYQGIAGAGGLVNTDRDDLDAMYRRRGRE